MILRPENFASRGPANGKDITAAMAAQLRKVGIPDTEREAIRLLSQHGFRYGDVAVLAEDALFQARQAAVTEIITAPEQPAHSRAGVANGAIEQAPPASMAVPNTAASLASPPPRAASPRPGLKREAGGGSSPEQAERSEGVANGGDSDAAG